MSEGVSATTTKLYRDCLRLARHLAGETKKGDKMREMIRMQFRAGAAETDEGKIEMLKFAAVRGLSNYMVCALVVSCPASSPVFGSFVALLSVHA